MNKMRNKAAYANLVMTIMENKNIEDLRPLGELELNAVDASLNSLSEKEKVTIRSRFGLGGKKLSLKEIGECFGLSSSRIGQIEKKGLRKLRHPSRIRFIDFLFQSCRCHSPSKQHLSAQQRFMQKPLYYVDITRQALNILEQNNINTLGDLAQKSETELRKYLNRKFFRIRKIDEVERIKEILEAHGLQLGMNDAPQEL